MTFPKSPLDGNRPGITASQPLKVLEGELPPELLGTWYLVAAAADVALPQPSARKGRVPFLNGDGAVYAIGFDGTSCSGFGRLVESPCYKVDTFLASSSTFKKYRFKNRGLTRISDRLGSRNFSNTALQAVKLLGRTRLLATYDAGWPVELDPVSLAYLGPVGRTHEWVGQMATTLPFRFVSSCAHPAWDEHERRLFLIELGRNYAKRGQRAVQRCLDWKKRPPEREVIGVSSFHASELEGRNAEDDFADFETTLRKLDETTEQPTKDALRPYIADVYELVKSMKPSDIGVNAPEPMRPGREFLALLAWDGRALQRWHVVTRDDAATPVYIRSSAHQILVTQHHVVIVDTAFKFDLDLAPPLLEPSDPFVRRTWSRQQPLTLRLYVVAKQDLRPDAKVVAATRYLYHAEATHFFAEYRESDNSIVLHCANNRATDPAEFLFVTDRIADALAGTSKPPPIPGPLQGMMPGGMDRTSFETIRIPLGAPAATQMAQTVAPIIEHEAAWTVALGSSAGAFGAGAPRDTIDETVWYSHGAATEQISQLVYDMYDFATSKKRPRQVPMADVRAIMKAGVPAGLFAVRHGAQGRVRVFRAAPDGGLLLSPQVVERAAKRFVLCTCFRAKAGTRREVIREIWILDGRTLDTLCRLDASPLDWPYTLHSTWIDTEDMPDKESDEPPRGFSEADYAHIPKGNNNIRKILAAAFGWKPKKTTRKVPTSPQVRPRSRRSAAR